MYATIKTLSVLALAGTVVSVPLADAPTKVQVRRGGWGEWGWGKPQGDKTQAWTNWAATETVYVTADAPAAEVASPTPTPEASAPATGGQFFGRPPPQSGAPASYSAPAPSPEPEAPAADSGSAPANDGSWQSVVAEWRSNMGLAALTPDATLTNNAQDTADSSSGGLKHKLNPGSMAQVLAPGDANDFEHVYVGGWLCELPNAPGLNGVCAEQSKGWDYAGQTGHAEILTSGNYKKIGCAHSSSTGVWSCDLA